MEKKELLLLVLIGMLLLTTAVQGIQLVKLSSTDVVVSSTSTASSSVSSGNKLSTPANLQDLPSMVGGC